MTYTLYHFPLQPHCRKIRLLLAEQARDFILEEEPYWEKREAFANLNPLGEVPVLQGEDGFAVCSHAVITEWLHEVKSVPKLVHKDRKKRAQQRYMADWFDRRFYLDVTRNLLNERYFNRMRRSSSPNAAMIREAKAALKRHFEMLTEALQYKTSEWMVGEAVSIADISAAAQISVVDYFGDIRWADYPQVKRWYALMKSRPSMREVLKDRVRGVRPPDEYDNPDF